MYLCELSEKSMTSEEKVKHWVKISDGDLQIAKTMLDHRYRVYTGFMCHQVIEKIFKAAYEKLKNETPPYIHDLPRLAERSGIYDLLSSEQKLFLNTINPLNVEARYPDYKERIAKSLTDERCEYIYEQTILLQQWIKEKIL